MKKNITSLLPILKKILIVLLLGILSLFYNSEENYNASDSSNKKFESFIEVKRLLLGKIYYDHRKTFYCDCNFSSRKKVRCKTGKRERATRIEWEHVVPASRFGHTFGQWQSQKDWKCSLPPLVQNVMGLKCRKVSGRKNARNQSKEYRLMESDMYNLTPAIGLINQRRSNRDYGIIQGEKREFGSCDFEIYKSIAEPKPNIRGNIARTYFYMDKAYPGRIQLTSSEKKMFSQWDKSDPVSRWECQRARRIKKIQGNENSFVASACKKASL